MDTRKLLLTASDIEQMPGERKVHFLNPNAVRINKSLGDAVGLSQIGVHKVFIEPGHDTTEYHIHHYEEECVYVLSGTATAIIGDDRYPLGPGDFIGLPRSTLAHNIINVNVQPHHLPRQPHIRHPVFFHTGALHEITGIQTSALASARCGLAAERSDTS